MITWEAHACLPLSPQADFAPDRRVPRGRRQLRVDQRRHGHESAVAGARGHRRLSARRSPRIRIATCWRRASRTSSGRRPAGGSRSASISKARCRSSRIRSMVALYRDLGVRQIHLAYNRNNSVADGCHDVERGLTALGRRIVAAVNDAGLLMDCSHTGRRCSLDIMAASTQPVIFSHSNPLALVEHGRNVTDEQIRACAATGGVVCVSGVSMFVGVARAVGGSRGEARGVRRRPRRRRPRGHRARHQLSPGRCRRHAARRLRSPTTGGRRRRATNRAISRSTYPPVAALEGARGGAFGHRDDKGRGRAVMGGNMERVARQVWRG